MIEKWYVFTKNETQDHKMYAKNTIRWKNQYTTRYVRVLYHHTQFIYYVLFALLRLTHLVSSSSLSYIYITLMLERSLSKAIVTNRDTLSELLDTYRHEHRQYLFVYRKCDTQRRKELTLDKQTHDTLFLSHQILSDESKL